MVAPESNSDVGRSWKWHGTSQTNIGLSEAYNRRRDAATMVGFKTTRITSEAGLSRANTPLYSSCGAILCPLSGERDVPNPLVLVYGKCNDEPSLNPGGFIFSTKDFDDLKT